MNKTPTAELDETAAALLGTMLQFIEDVPGADTHTESGEPFAAKRTVFNLGYTVPRPDDRKALHEVYSVALRRLTDALLDSFKMSNMPHLDQLNQQAVDWLLTKANEVWNGTHRFSKRLPKGASSDRPDLLGRCYSVGFSYGFTVIVHNGIPLPHPMCHMFLLQKKRSDTDFVAVEAEEWEDSSEDDEAI